MRKHQIKDQLETWNQIFEHKVDVGASCKGLMSDD